jgi:hypothetical protein
LKINKYSKNVIANIGDYSGMTPLGNSINSSSDIKFQQGCENCPLVMLISHSISTKTTVETYLLDTRHRVVGPFDNVDSGFMFIRREQVSLIIFDATGEEEENRSFQQMLTTDAREIPSIVISMQNDYFTHNVIKYLRPPIDPSTLFILINELLDTDIEQPEIYELVNFINNIFRQLIELTPEMYKTDIRMILESNLKDLSFRNSEYLNKNEESLSLQIINLEEAQKQVDSLCVHFQMIFQSIIESIDELDFEKWGKSLITESIQTTLMSSSKDNPLINKIVSDFDIIPQDLQSSLDSMVPLLEEEDKDVAIALVTLFDSGPELITKFGFREDYLEEIDDTFAAQVLTLVGQGSSYHEGIYGPIPLTTKFNLTAIIYSKLLKSEIKDTRMKGHSLTVVTLVFNRDLLSSLPSQSMLKNTFDPISQCIHVSDITEFMLTEILEAFKSNVLKLDK